LPAFWRSTTLQDLADHVGHMARHVSRTLRFSYLASNVLETLLIKCTPPAVSKSQAFDNESLS